MNPQWPLFLFWLAQGSAWIAGGRPVIGLVFLIPAAILGWRLENALKADRGVRR